MMSALMAKIGGAIILALGAVVGLFVSKRKAVNADRDKAKIRDMENAEDIRHRGRNADERLRKFDDAGFRD
jgi:hypothetical protein